MFILAQVVIVTMSGMNNLKTALYTYVYGSTFVGYGLGQWMVYVQPNDRMEQTEPNWKRCFDAYCTSQTSPLNIKSIANDSPLSSMEKKT